MNLESRAKECVQCQSLISKEVSYHLFVPGCFQHLSYAVPLAGTYCPDIASAARLLLDHSNNFALCMLLMLILGIIVLSFEGKFRGITAAALVMSVLNIGV